MADAVLSRSKSKRGVAVGSWNSKINKRYSPRFREIRNACITTRSLCEYCLEQEKFTPVTEVHHVLPFEHGDAHDETKLRTMCKPPSVGP